MTCPEGKLSKEKNKHGWKNHDGSREPVFVYRCHDCLVYSGIYVLLKVHEVRVSHRRVDPGTLWVTSGHTEASENRKWVGAV